MFGRSKQWIVLTLITLWIGSSIARGAGLDDAQFLHNTASFFSLVLDVLYVILWPLLIVAGWALDNSLVLGEVFHLDNALWQFWVIVRNLANFALGFIVIWMIAKHLWGKGSEREIISTIGKALIAGIGIQVSRFLMIALLDISTIAIYSIGAMPLQVLPDAGSNTNRIIKPVITMNNVGIDSDAKTKKDDELFTVNYTCGGGSLDLGTYTTKDTSGNQQTKDKVIQQCLIHNNYIIARRPDLDPATSSTDWSNGSINFNYCVANNYIYKVNNAAGSDQAASERYYIPLMGQEEKTKNASGQDVNQTPVMFSGNNSTAGGFKSAFDDASWSYMEQLQALGTVEGGKVKESYNEQLGCSTFKDLQSKAQGMAGVMTTMFSSIMQFGTINLFSNNDSMGRISIIFFIRAIVGIMLLAPLVVLAISLIKRVGYLWIALVGSPAIILLKAFGKDIGIDTNDKMKMLDLGEVISLIFMPVATIFALSIGIVFLATLQNTVIDPTSNQQNVTFENLGIEHYDAKGGQASCYTIFITDVCYESDGMAGDGRGSFLNYFSWIIIQLFGIGVLWMIVFASFKASSISSDLGKQVSDLAQNMALSAPIIPIGGSEKIGLGALGVGSNNRNAVFDALNTHYNNKIRGQTVALFPDKKGDGTNGSGSQSSSNTKITSINTTSATAITDAVKAGASASVIQESLNTGSLSKNKAVIDDIISQISDTNNTSGKILFENKNTNGESDQFHIRRENDSFVVEKVDTPKENKNDNPENDNTNE